MPGPNLLSEPPRGLRPGGRSARVRARVLAATLELITERGYEGFELPEVARRAGVHPTTVYRRWGAKARLVGEALLERSLPLSATPDTGSLRTDVEELLLAGSKLIRTAPVRALFEVLVGQWTDPSAEISRARDHFWAAHLSEVVAIVDRAVARSELPSSTDPAAFAELLIGPALFRALFTGRGLDCEDSEEIVGRALAAVSRLPAREKPV